MNSLDGQNRIRNFMSVGVSQVNINAQNFKKVLLPFPPLPEQKKIASILTTVDDKLESLRTKKSQYTTLKKGLMQKLLTGQIRVKT